jgi:3D (Asp-Asp-Asp) domain-containing protein
MVSAAVPVACGLLALAFAVPAAGDPRQDSGTASPLSATARVQATLASLAAREAALDNASARATVQLHVARRMLVVARRNLARRLRMMYEAQAAEPLEVLLGARSFTDAVNGLDSLRRTADQDRAWIEQAKALRRKTELLQRSLAARRLAVTHLRESAEAAAAALAAIRTPVAATAPRRIAVHTAAQPRPVAATEPAPAPGRTLTLLVSAYALPGFTATGTPVAYGVVAVDPAVIPLGTRFTIPGYGDAVAADTGSAIRGMRVDVWLPTVERARAWGTRTVTVTIQRR